MASSIAITLSSSPSSSNSSSSASYRESEADADTKVLVRADTPSVVRNLSCIITTHVSSDFDALGSLLLVGKLFPDAVLVWPGTQDPHLRTLVHSLCADNTLPSHRFLRHLTAEQAAHVRTVVVVDAGHPSRVKHLPEPLLARLGVADPTVLPGSDSTTTLCSDVSMDALSSDSLYTAPTSLPTTGDLSVSSSTASTSSSSASTSSSSSSASTSSASTMPPSTTGPPLTLHVVDHHPRNRRDQSLFSAPTTLLHRRWGSASAILVHLIRQHNEAIACPRSCSAASVVKRKREEQPTLSGGCPDTEREMDTSSDECTATSLCSTTEDGEHMPLHWYPAAAEQPIELNETELAVAALGIYQDTGCFLYPSTTAHDLSAASYLRAQDSNSNAHQDWIRRFIQAPTASGAVNALALMPEASRRILHQLFQSASVHLVEGCKVAIADVQSTHNVNNFAVIVDAFLQSSPPETTEHDPLHQTGNTPPPSKNALPPGVQAVFCLGSFNDYVCLVGRSLGSSQVDTSLICKRFGGGGHRTASAASIRNRTAIEIREELFAYICVAVRAHQKLTDVLTTPSVSLRADETISNATLLFVRLNLKKVPVVDQVGHVVGIMDRVAAEKARQHQLGDSLVADFMETDVHCLTVDSPVEKVIELILRRHQRLVPILDPNQEATRPKRMMDEDRSVSDAESGTDQADDRDGDDKKNNDDEPIAGSSRPVLIPRASTPPSNLLRVAEPHADYQATSPLSPTPILDADFASRAPIGAGGVTARAGKAKVPALVGVVTRADVVSLLLREPSRFPTTITPDRVVVNEMNQLLPRSILNLLRTSGKLADQLGVKVYVVGGFVRDLLLSHCNDDVDLVVEGDGIAFAEELNKLLGCHILRHPEFGTAVVTMAEDKLKVDVATSRLEYYPQPVALPTVELSSLKMDMFRRDFTINAMAIQLNISHYGRLVDYFHAEEDLEFKRIRVLHSLSFVEDPTRVFRAIRFEKRYDGHIDKQTLRLVRHALRNGVFDRLSGSRLYHELEKIMNDKSPLESMRRVYQLHLLDAIHPQLAQPFAVGPMQECIEAAQFYDMLYLKESINRTQLYLLALCYYLKDRPFSEVLERLLIPSGTQERYMQVRYHAKHVTHHLNRALRAGNPPSHSELYDLFLPLPLEGILFVMASLTCEKVASRRLFTSYLTVIRCVKTDVNGNDLKQMGYRPGALFKHVLDALRVAKLDMVAPNRETQIRMAERLCREYVANHPEAAQGADSKEKGRAPKQSKKNRKKQK